MKIHLQDIPQGGLTIKKEINASAIDLMDKDFPVLTPLVIDGRINRIEDMVIARLEVKARYQLTCSRCLDRVDDERRDRLELCFDVTPKTQFFDIGEEIRQEILLIFTSAVILCRKDCKGLCLNCGVNLNREECHHGASKETALKAEKP